MLAKVTGVRPGSRMGKKVGQILGRVCRRDVWSEVRAAALSQSYSSDVRQSPFCPIETPYAHRFVRNLIRAPPRPRSATSTGRQPLILEINRQTYAPGTRTSTFFPVNLLKLTLSSMSLIRISTSGTLSPAFKGEADARDATAEWAAPAAAEMMEAIGRQYQSSRMHAQRFACHRRCA